MDLTQLRRTVLVMLLVATPWFLVGVFSFAFLMQAHLQEHMTYSIGMRAAVIAGAIMCFLALVLCADGVRRKQANPLLYLFAFSALWFLLEWPARALPGILRS